MEELRCSIYKATERLATTGRSSLPQNWGTVGRWWCFEGPRSPWEPEPWKLCLVELGSWSEAFWWQPEPRRKRSSSCRCPRKHKYKRRNILTTLLPLTSNIPQSLPLAILPRSQTAGKPGKCSPRKGQEIQIWGKTGYLTSLNVSFFSLSKWIFFNIYFWERQRETECEMGRGRERGRHRIQSRLQALSCQHRARHRARTHRQQDHDLNRSQTLNWLSHPGAPQNETF